MVDRVQVIVFAMSLDGLGANPRDPETRAHYISLIAPVEPPAYATALADKSGCELVMRAVLREFISHQLLEHPYRNGKAGEDLRTIAQESGALHGPERDPEPGDIVIVGGGSDGGGPEHAWMSLGGIEGLDGGQRDDQRYQVIRIRNHDIVNGWERGHLSNDPGGGMRRKIRLVLDLEAILSEFGR